MSRKIVRSAPVLMVLLLLTAGPLALSARAAEPEWRLEPVRPPQLPGESPQEHEGRPPIGLGKIGDMKFFAPNLGLLITAGNPPTVPPGQWVYNGREWHELSTVCGATDGRIAWVPEAPDEFWTISDGRPGQSGGEHGLPPLADNTLCHFAGGQVVGSFASLAFQPDSYQAMHAAGCLSASDCWFGGESLPEGQVGAFQLHWNGSAIVAQPNPQGHPVEDMLAFDERLYESVRLRSEDLVGEVEPEENLRPADLHLIRPEGVGSSPFVSLKPGVPIYRPDEFPTALDFLHLSAGEGVLWGAGDPVETAPKGSEAGEVTIVRESGESWSQLFGDETTDPPSGNPFTKFIPKSENPTPEEEVKERQNEAVASIAAEPGSEDAWLALTSRENTAEGALAPAMVARVSSDKTVSARQSLGARGAAHLIACPAPGDCWLATTQGWLFHLSEEGNRHLPEDADPAFSSTITFRPTDAGIPPVVSDALPIDDSGLPEGPPPYGKVVGEPATTTSETRVPVALLSHLRSRLIHGSMLELRFHLAVKARVRLVAKRHTRVVAATPMRILDAGNRRLLLALDRRRWPTKLGLQTHALAPLPTTSTHGVGNNTVSTGLFVLPRTPLLGGSELLP